MTIPLPPPLPTGSSCQPGLLGLKFPYGGLGCPTLTRAKPLFGIAPGGACRAVPVARSAVGSYPTVSPLPRKRGGLFSVALSLGLPPPGVTRHPYFMESGLSSHDASFPRGTQHHTRSSSLPRERIHTRRTDWRQSPVRSSLKLALSRQGFAGPIAAAWSAPARRCAPRRSLRCDPRSGAQDADHGSR